MAAWHGSDKAYLQPGFLKCLETVKHCQPRGIENGLMRGLMLDGCFLQPYHEAVLSGAPNPVIERLRFLMSLNLSAPY